MSEEVSFKVKRSKGPGVVSQVNGAGQNILG